MNQTCETLLEKCGQTHKRHSCWPLHMDEQRQDDQLEPLYNHSVLIQDVALKTYWERWLIDRWWECQRDPCWWCDMMIHTHTHTHTHTHWLVFINDLGDLGSIPGRVIPKTQKMVLDFSLFNTQHYKIGIKVKFPLLHLGVVSTEKEHLVRPQRWSPTLLIYSFSSANALFVILWTLSYVHLSVSFSQKFTNLWKFCLLKVVTWFCMI